MTQKITGTPMAKCLVIALSVVLMTACGRESTSTTDAPARKTSAVDAPEVDIHTAVLTGNIEALKQHIAAGSNINEKDPFGGSSPLITASVFNQPGAAKILLEAGADINFQNNDGSTALHTSAFFCRPEIVKLLIEKGADKTIRNKYDATAYDNVASSFAEVKDVYKVMEQALGPMGLKLDYDYLQKTRPEIASMLK